MSNVKFFNHFDTSGSKKVIKLDKSLSDYIDQPVLIDDVDTTITSFLKTYGQPLHIDVDDFEEGDDRDFDEFDDGDDVESVDSVEPVSVEPVEPAPAAPVEPAPAEPVSE